jgi:predicted transcriptional regulator
MKGGALMEYTTTMSIELSSNVEEQLRGLAMKQGRDVRTLVEEAVRQYLESAAITDLEASEVAETQTKLLGELSDISEWQAGKA